MSPWLAPSVTSELTPRAWLRSRRFGGYSEGETPGPIPNPAVKPFSADGTALVTGWESRSPPRLFQKGPHSGALFCWSDMVEPMNRDRSGSEDIHGGSRGTRRGPRSVPGGAHRPTVPRFIIDDVRTTARPGQAEAAAMAFQDAASILESDRPEAAVPAAEMAKNLAPRSGAVRELLGIALYRSERFRQALRELQAYRRITGRVDQNHLIADSYRALDAPEKAVEPAREALSAAIDDEVRAEAAVVGASALADLDRFDEALGMVRAIRTTDQTARPFDLRLWYVAGDILERSGRPDDAALEFERVVRHDPSAFDAADRLARLQRS
jgi:tetratricopeptide repeat protein